MSTAPIQIRVGDLSREHIGMKVIEAQGYKAWITGTIEQIRHHIRATYTLVDVGTSDGFHGSLNTDLELTLTPPPPVRRRITWADLREHPPKNWDGAKVSEGADGWPLSAWRANAPEPIAKSVPALSHSADAWVAIEVPAGHPLATTGEAIDE